MDCSPPGSSVHGVSQTRIVEWVASFYSRGSPWPRDRPAVQADSLPLCHLEAPFYVNRLLTYVRGLVTGTANVSSLQDQSERGGEEGKWPRRTRSSSKYQRPEVWLWIPGERWKVWGPECNRAEQKLQQSLHSSGIRRTRDILFFQ